MNSTHSNKVTKSALSPDSLSSIYLLELCNFDPKNAPSAIKKPFSKNSGILVLATSKTAIMNKTPNAMKPAGSVITVRTHMPNGALAGFPSGLLINAIKIYASTPSRMIVKTKNIAG
jgi:hypothetical protein